MPRFRRIGRCRLITEPVIVILADHLKYIPIAARNEIRVFVSQAIMNIGLRDRARELPAHRSDLDSDVYTLRRILPEDRGMKF